MDSEFLILDSLFSKISDGVCFTNSEGKVLYANPAAEQLLGLDADMPLCQALCGKLTCGGKTGVDSDCPLRQPASGLGAVTFQGDFRPGDTFQWKDFSVKRIARSKSVRVHCMTMRTPLFDSIDGEKHLTIIEDASAEEALKARHDYWIRMLTHDLRAPLTNIFGSLRAMEDAPGTRALPPSENALLKIALRNCGRMLEMLDLFLDLARLDANQMPVAPVELDAAELARSTAEEQGAGAKARGIEIEVVAPASIRLVSDGKLLFRVIQNLLNNAVKYAFEKSTIKLTAAETAEGVSLSVEDKGPGIPPEMLPVLFDRFFQAQARRQGRFKGQGLGLSFCHEAVFALGGDISVKSELGKGTCFTVVLPKSPIGARHEPAGHSL